jgi:hypothetical protein
MDALVSRLVYICWSVRSAVDCIAMFFLAIGLLYFLREIILAGQKNISSVRQQSKVAKSGSYN